MARTSATESKRWGSCEVITAPCSPWQNAYVERVIGSIRRECLDHLVIFNERHLRRILSSYIDYYQRTRTHLSLDKDCPDQRDRGSAHAFHRTVLAAAHNLTPDGVLRSHSPNSGSDLIFSRNTRISVRSVYGERKLDIGRD